MDRMPTDLEDVYIVMSEDSIAYAAARSQEAADAIIANWAAMGTTGLQTNRIRISEDADICRTPLPWSIHE